MGCINQVYTPEFHLCTGSTVYITSEGKVLKRILVGKDMLSVEHNNYRVSNESGFTTSLHYSNIFPDENKAYLSLMPCEIERKIPILLDNAFTLLKPEKENRFIIWWNRLIEKLKIK